MYIEMSDIQESDLKNALIYLNFQTVNILRKMERDTGAMNRTPFRDRISFAEHIIYTNC